MRDVFATSAGLRALRLAAGAGRTSFVNPSSARTWVARGSTAEGKNSGYRCIAFHRNKVQMQQQQQHNRTC